MRKTYVIILFIGIFIGFILYYLYNTFTIGMCSIDQTKQYGLSEITYHFSQPIQIIITSLAVIVALFGREIHNLFFHPKCKLDIKSFSESLGDSREDQSPKAINYFTELTICNNGNRELSNLELEIKKIEYKKSQNDKYKAINNTNLNPVFYWDRDTNKTKINLREKESKTVVLATITPKTNQGTPDSTQTTPQRINIISFCIRHMESSVLF